jgi:ComEC/Rec2-related protein
MYPSGAAGYGFTNERLSLLADNVAYKSLAHYSAVEILRYNPPGAASAFFSGMRQNLFGRMERYIGGQDAAFYTALITGDKSALDMSVKTSFANLGISHLLATSGLHIGILLMIFGIIFKKLRTPIVIKSVISFAVIMIFLCFAGFRVSMVRASFMWMLLTMSKLWGERVSPLNTLGVAMLVLLAFNPLCIFDISFVLSCASVAGIVLFSKMLMRVQKIKYAGKILGLVLTTVAVVAFTWPVVAYYFNSISLLSPIYNIIFVPISSVALFVGMVFGLLSGISFLAPVLGTLAKALSHIIIQGAQWLSGFAPSLNMVSPPFGVIVLWMTGAASLSGLVFKTKKTWLRIVSLSVMAAAVVIMGVTQVRIENEQSIKAYADGSGMLIYIKDGKQNALILDGESYIAYNVLRKNAADGVDMLIYSGDSDEDLGELIDSLDSVEIGAVYAARDVADVYNLQNAGKVLPLNKASMLGYEIEVLPFKAKSKTAKTHYAAHIYNKNQNIIYIDALYLREGAFEGRHFSDAVCSAWTKSRAENISVLDFDSLYFCDAGVFAHEGALALERAGANIYNITQGTAELYRGEGN